MLIFVYYYIIYPNRDKDCKYSVSQKNKYWVIMCLIQSSQYTAPVIGQLGFSCESVALLGKVKNNRGRAATSGVQLQALRHCWLVQSCLRSTHTSASGESSWSGRMDAISQFLRQGGRKGVATKHYVAAASLQIMVLFVLP